MTFVVVRPVCGTVVMVRCVRGEATCSKSQVVAYACYVRTLKYSPPTIYPEQDSAPGGHTGP